MSDFTKIEKAFFLAAMLTMVGCFILASFFWLYVIERFGWTTYWSFGVAWLVGGMCWAWHRRRKQTD